MALADPLRARLELADRVRLLAGAAHQQRRRARPGLRTIPEGAVVRIDDAVLQVASREFCGAPLLTFVAGRLIDNFEYIPCDPVQRPASTDGPDWADPAEGGRPV